uniref:FAD-dependent oxidoreductase n=1 Tax=uncultured Erythrobacter sp. TaxID=263913 RepID=UPI002613E452|nr:FAD-dependent oxidoreductase [uncultured Erythrobacter sp.]
MPSSQSMLAVWECQQEGNSLGRSAIIIGAGVIGVTSAYALARRGWQVTIVDRSSGPAMEASRANGAQLSYCYTDALGSPAALASLPRFVFGGGGVSFRLPMSTDYACWLTQFALNCSAAKFRKNTLAVLDLAQHSRQAMAALRERHDLQFAHRVAGKIHLLYSEKDRARAEQMQALKSARGCEQHVLDRSELARLDPALAGNDALDSDVIGAISTPSEVVGDPYLFCRNLLSVLTSDYGVKTRFNCAASALEDGPDGARLTIAHGEKLTADLAVVAAATDSNRLLAPLGRAITVQPMKGYSFEMPLSRGSPDISVTDSKRRLVFTHLKDRMRVAGIAELGNGSNDIDPAKIGWLIDAARDCMPDAGDYAKAGKFWAGLRPVTPNSQPVISRASKAIAINTGHGALGWTLAMGSAERLAELVEN